MTVDLALLSRPLILRFQANRKELVIRDKLGDSHIIFRDVKTDYWVAVNRDRLQARQFRTVTALREHLTNPG